MNEVMAYIAGIVDGEGSITYGQQLQHRKGKPRAYKYWNIRIEVAMTHKETIEYLHEALGCGHVNIRPKMSHQNFDQCFLQAWIDARLQSHTLVVLHWHFFLSCKLLSRFNECWNEISKVFSTLISEMFFWHVQL